MRLRVLGAAGSETPDCNPPGYLLDKELLIDAGTVASVLSEEEQGRIQWILLSHAHLDHIRDIPFLADNRLMRGDGALTILAPDAVLDTFKEHIFNDLVWPDFSRLPNSQNPTIRFASLEPNKEVAIGGYQVLPIPVHHSVTAYGYRIRRDERTLVYSGDTGPTDALWQHGAGSDVLLVEVSFPNKMERLAVESGHLTPSLLEAGLKTADRLPGRILTVHAKPAFRETIVRELSSHVPGAVLVHRGEECDI